MLEQTGGAVSILMFLAGAMSWIRRLLTQKGIRVEAAMEPGPITRRSGFTEPAVKITVVNEGENPIKIRDIRLVFCDE